MANFIRGLHILLILLLLLALIPWLVDRLRAPKAPQGFEQQIFHAIDGRTLTIAALSEKKPLLIYFWSRDCSVCAYTNSKLIKMSDSGYNVLAVAQHSGNDIQVVRLLQGKHLTMPVINDPTGAIAAQWQIGAMPTLIIVKKGKVVHSTTGWTSATGIQLRYWWVNKWV